MAGLRLKLAEPCLAVPSSVPSFSTAWQTLVSSFNAVPWVHFLPAVSPENNVLPAEAPLPQLCSLKSVVSHLPLY